MFFDRCFQDGLFDVILVISEHFRAPLGADFGSFGALLGTFLEVEFGGPFWRDFGGGSAAWADLLEPYNLQGFATESGTRPGTLRSRGPAD